MSSKSRAGIGPVAFGGPFGKAVDLPGLVECQPSEKPQFYDFGGLLILSGQFSRNSLTSRSRSLSASAGGPGCLSPAAVRFGRVCGLTYGAPGRSEFGALLRPRRQKNGRNWRRGCLCPCRRAAARLREPGRWAGASGRRFMEHFCRRQFAQLPVNQRQKPVSGLLALFNGLQDVGHIIHGLAAPRGKWGFHTKGRGWQGFSRSSGIERCSGGY